MSAPASRPEPATPSTGWRVEVVMPTFSEGRFAGWPVGWQSLNRLPTGVRCRKRKDGGPASPLGKIEWDAARREWRQAAYAAVIAAGVPRHLGRIEVTVELRFPDASERDPGNFEPTIKPCIDALGPQRVYRSAAKKKDYGLVVELGRGIIETDAPRCLVRPNAVIGEPLGRANPIKGMVILHVRQLPLEVSE